MQTTTRFVNTTVITGTHQQRHEIGWGNCLIGFSTTLVTSIGSNWNNKKCKLKLSNSNSNLAPHWSQHTSILKYEFCKKSLRKMQLWQVEHFFHKKGTCIVLHLPFCKEKVFNLSELHFPEVTSYKIHTFISFAICILLV